WRDVRTMAFALYSLGLANAFQGNNAEAQARLEQSLVLYRALGDKLGVSQPLLVLGLSALRVGEYERAQAWFAEAAALERELGDQNPLAFNLRHWGFALIHQHDDAGAIAKFRESLTLNVEIGDKQGIAACLGAYTAVTLACEQFERTAQLFGAVEVLLEA